MTLRDTRYATHSSKRWQSWFLWRPPPGKSDCLPGSQESRVQCACPQVLLTLRLLWSRSDQGILTFEGEWNKTIWTNQFLRVKSAIFLFSQEEPLLFLHSIEGIAGGWLNKILPQPHSSQRLAKMQDQVKPAQVLGLISRSFMLCN